MNNRSTVVEFPIEEIQDIFVNLWARSLRKEDQQIIVWARSFGEMVCSLERCSSKWGSFLSSKEKGSITISLRIDNLRSLNERLWLFQEY